MEPHKSNLQSEVTRWIREAFEKENFTIIDCEISGTSEKGDGYMSDIVFGKVRVLTAKGKEKDLDLAIKCSKDTEALRKTHPVQNVFERETFIYTIAVPSFQRFESERNVKIMEMLFPKCFGSIVSENREILFLQNLRALGFELHDRFQPLDINHLKLTFEYYGKWHGLSMAYRDQKPNEFNELFENLEDILEMVLCSETTPLNKTEKHVFTILENTNEFELRDKLRGRMLHQSFAKTFAGLLKIKSNLVLLHGDCWNNNMMFRYEDLDRRLPTELKFLDLQVSKLGSPIFDLAYHVYSTASEKELQHFGELLRFYHATLSKTIRSLGSDPEKLCSYSELVRQWKEYSCFGIIFSSMALPIILSNKEDAPDLQDMIGDNISELIQKVTESNNDLSSRIIANIRHFLNYDDF